MSFQICVLEGHVLCANYLCMVITNRMEKPIYHIHDSPLLHKVTYLGCAQHLHLLLKVSFGRLAVVRIFLLLLKHSVKPTVF